jgi:serine/threonine protein kinase
MGHEVLAQMSGSLDRRGMLGFWSRRRCVLRHNTLFVLKDSTEELSLPIDATTKVSLLDPTSPRFVIERDGQEPLHFRAPDGNLAAAWVHALRACGFHHPELSLSSFRPLSVIGEGFYGKVTLCRKVDTGELFAIKSIRKRRLVQADRVHTVLTERNVLSQASHPFVISLFYAFQSRSKFYLVLEWASGRELLAQMRRKALEIDDIRLYTAEIALALRQLHSIGVIYRDLKPENILLDAAGHVKLTDFGLSKILNGERLTSTFCGTNEYLAPEIVSERPYGIEVDWWGLGICVYEMFYGRTPFASQSRAQLFKRIVNCDVPFPAGGEAACQKLIEGLLEKDPANRFSFEEVRKHEFFAGIDFADVLERKIKPSFIPANSEVDEGFRREHPDSAASPGPSSMGHLQGFSFDRNGTSADVWPEVHSSFAGPSSPAAFVEVIT